MKVRHIFLLMMVICFVTAMTLTAGAETFKIKIAHVDTPQSPNHLAFQVFKKLAEERSNGRIQVSIHPGSALGTQRESIESAQMGSIELCNSTSAIAAVFVPELFLLDIPFMFNSYEEARTAVMSPDILEFFDKGFTKKNIMMMGYMEQGFRNVTNSKRPIWSLEDFKGLKLRTMEAPLHMANFKALGASPTPMAFGELFTAMQQGVVDGQENPFYVPWLEKFYEVQKYLSVTNHVYDAMPVVGSKKWFDNLPPDIQEIVTDSMADAQTYNFSINKRTLDDALMKLLAVKGFQINAVPEKGLAEIKKVGQEAVMKQLNKRLGKETVSWWVNRIDEIVQEVRAQ